MNAFALRVLDLDFSVSAAIGLISLFGAAAMDGILERAESIRKVDR